MAKEIIYIKEQDSNYYSEEYVEKLLKAAREAE